MRIKKGNQSINNNTMHSIIDIKCQDNYEIYIFQGNLSINDIIIKYKEEGKRIRTPKHIHWVTDILMKMQADELLTKNFLKEVQKDWNESKPLKENNLENIKTIIDESNVKIDEYEELNDYGEYDIDFLYVLLKLLMVQEKTNRNDAYMFGRIIDKLLEDKIDIFSIVSSAGFNGRG